MSMPPRRSCVGSFPEQVLFDLIGSGSGDEVNLAPAGVERADLRPSGAHLIS